MNKKRFLALFIALSLVLTLAFPILAAGQRRAGKKNPERIDPKPRIDLKLMRAVKKYNPASDRQKTKATKDSRRAQATEAETEQPEWVTQALERALEQLQSRSEGMGIEDAASEFILVEAMQDGRNYIDIRLAQVRESVEVFGGELVAHLDDQLSLYDLSGRIFPEARIDTAPAITEEQAVEFARTAVAEEGDFSGEPSVKLVILPEKIKTDDDNADGATLVFEVDLQSAEEGALQRKCFVNATDGEVVWRFDSTPHQTEPAFGTGYSLYSGQVLINTLLTGPDSYSMADALRGFSSVGDADGSTTSAGEPIYDGNNIWGDGTATDPQTLAVDAHFGIANSWSYFKTLYQREGPDGKATGVRGVIRARFLDDRGNPYDANATANNNTIRFGNGDGVTTGPFISPDIVGHEFTHLVIDKTANLTYANESGAVNESFCDIFGTAIEFFANPARGDYLIGEDICMPAGNFLRSMENPALGGDPDHYSNYINTTGDNGGVHTNSGIMNQAFYLMSVGGTNRTSNISVPGIGRRAAEDLFFIALERRLTKSSKFIDVANATRNLAMEIYGPDSDALRSVERAWGAVGVFRVDANVRQPYVDSDRLLLYQIDTPWARTGQLTRAGDFVRKNQYYNFSNDWTHIVPMGTNIFFYSQRSGRAAVGATSFDGSFTTLKTFPPGSFYYQRIDPSIGVIRGGWSHITYHKGYLLFYDERNGQAEIGRADETGYRTIKSYQTIAAGWTSIVSTQDKLLFYNSNTGRAVIGDWNYGTNPLSILVLKIYDNFSTGWTHIVDGGKFGGQIYGTLFYNR
jgi:thermolysin